MIILSEADAVGIGREQALALFRRLYPSEQAELSRDGTSFGSQTGLSRTVQVLVGLGVLLVIGAHAWWSTQGYEAMGIGIVLFVALASVALGGLLGEPSGPYVVVFGLLSGLGLGGLTMGMASAVVAVQHVDAKYIRLKWIGREYLAQLPPWDR